MQKLEFEVTGDVIGMRLDRAVAAVALKRGVELSNSKAKRLVEDGRVRLDDREAWKASRSLRGGQRIAVEIPDELIAVATSRVSLSDAVIYRDDVLVAVNKPAGVPTHATHDPDRDHVHAALKRLLGARGDDPYVAVHHRLDVDTSGVLVFATDRAANKGLADAFAEREAAKTYLALVRCDEELPDAFTVQDHLSRDPRAQGRKMRSVHSGGDRAETTFKTLTRRGEVALVEARPRTGRTHQIRVHLAESGSPILGDVQYGGPGGVGSLTVPRTMLHAWRLKLPHPTRDGDVELEAGVPDDFIAVADALGIETPER